MWQSNNTGWSFGPRCWECARYNVLQNVKLGGFGFAMNYDETDFKFICKIKVEKEPVWTGEIDTSQCERLTFDESGGFKLFNVDLVRMFGLKPI